MAHPLTGNISLKDLFGAWSPESIKHIYNKIDYNISDAELQKQGVTKDQFLMQPPQSVNLSQLLLEVSVQGNHGLDKHIKQQDLYAKNKISFLIACAIRKSLSDEALNIYIRREHIREAMRAYRAYILERAEKNYKDMIRATEEERAKYEEAMNKLVEYELEKILHQAEQQWHFHQGRIDDLHKSLDQHRERRLAIVQEAAKELRKSMDNFFNNSPAKDIYAKIPDEKKNEFAVEYIQESHKNLRKIQHCKEDKEENLAQIKLLEKEEQDLIRGIRESVANSPKVQREQINGDYSKSITKQHALDKQTRIDSDKNTQLAQIQQAKLVLREKNIGLDNEIAKLDANGKQIYQQVATMVYGAKIAEEIARVSPDEQARFEADPGNAKALEAVHGVLHEINNEMRGQKKEITMLKKEQVKIEQKKEEQVKAVAESTQVNPSVNRAALLARRKQMNSG